MPKQPLWWCLLGGLLAALWATLAATESLWVDELHSSWAVSGSLADVAGRARQGNQSPLYFWGLWAAVRTLGFFPAVSAELALRLPSILCWGATVGICLSLAAFRSPNVGRTSGLAEQQSTQAVAVATLFLWLWLDRGLLFYATEARVYAAVQLCNLLAWWAIVRLLTTARLSRASVLRCVIAWGLLAIVLLFLHVTSVLAVFWQCVAGTIGIGRQRPGAARSIWLYTVLTVGLATVLALMLSEDVWQQRSQWRAFAGEASLHHLLGMFPVLILGVPVLAARMIDRLWGNRMASPSSPIETKLWWLAAFGPWLTAWLVTACEVAPLLHRRFVIVSAIPLAILAIAELSKVRRPGLRILAAGATCGWLIVGQGTLANWRDGYLVGWQRVEGWREATAYLNRNIVSGEEVWCASGLIEGDHAHLPLEPALNRYLSFPLRGAYRVSTSSHRAVEPLALVGDYKRWTEQLSASPEPSLWIVFRGRPAALEAGLRWLREQDANWRHDGPREFGLVSVVRLRRPATRQPR